MQFTDQLHRTIDISSTPQKIISLVPSITELLCELGLEEKIAGVTKFCVHPANLSKEKPIIGGTKNLRIEKIKDLKPDLIFANKEENVKEQVEELEKFSQVWVSDVKTIDDAIDMITSIGKITKTENKAAKLVNKILSEKNKLHAKTLKHRKTAYLIWKNPYMTVGGDTFIHTMLSLAGFQNLFSQQERYPDISFEQLIILKPEVILLSSEPYPFKEKHASELQQIFPATQILLVDGEMFSWYGSRLQHSFQYFSALHKLL